MFKAYLYTVLSEISTFSSILTAVLIIFSFILNIMYLAYIMDNGFKEISDSMKLIYKRFTIATIVIIIINLLLPSEEILELLLLKQ